MGTNDGNAENVNKRYADFLGRACQAFWPALKMSIKKGTFDFTKFDKPPKLYAAIRKGFLDQENDSIHDLGLNIGKVSKEELAKLSVWDLKNLYSLFYQQVFGLYVEFPDKLMPEAFDEFAWPICIPGIISNEATYRSGKSDMPKWKFTDKSLDTEIQIDCGRDAWTHSYIVCTPADFEAGEKLKNISANDIEKQKINVLMFRERWILGLFIYWLTGLHLDRSVITLTGSRNSDGYVVGVSFDGGYVNVYRDYPDNAHDNLRSRIAVS